MKSGIVISTMTQQETELVNREIEWGGKIAYQTGIFYNKRLENSLLSFQFEGNYKKLGTSFFINNVDPNINPTSKAMYQFEYIGISVLPRIDLFPDKVLNPNFMFGAVLDIRTDSKLILQTESGTDSSLTNNSFIGGDLDKRTTELLFGYVMAGGIEIATKPVIITIEGRYSSLLTKVFNESVENMEQNAETYLLKILEDSRHNYFSFLVGFNFYF
tara:strand:+ start:5427 stop:6074 length:648 start_codon:yes stop_codon:yes gene_type:complete